MWNVEVSDDGGETWTVGLKYRTKTITHQDIHGKPFDVEEIELDKDGNRIEVPASFETEAAARAFLPLDMEHHHLRRVVEANSQEQ